MGGISMTPVELMGYGKPNMTNIPGELGKRIMRQIREAKEPDFSEVDKEIEEMTTRILAAREDEAV